MSFRQRILLLILIISILEMFLPTVSPKIWMIIIFLNTLGTSGVMILIVACLVVLLIEGKPLLKFSKAAAKVQWGLNFLLMAAVYVAGALCSEETRSTAFIYELLNPLLGCRSDSVLHCYVL